MIQFNIDPLVHTLDEVRALLDPSCRLHLGDEARKRIEKCRNYLDERMKSQKAPIYGVTTRCAMCLSTKTSFPSCRRIW